MSPAEINGTGVRLRAYRPDDAEAVAAGYNDPLSHRFLPALPAPFTIAHAERFLSEGITSIVAEGGVAYAIADQLDTNLFGVQLDQRVPRSINVIIDRMLQLGQPTAVFIAPAGTSN